MTSFLQRSIVFTLFALLISSCGPTLSDITRSLIQQGRNDEAIARMRRAVVLEPNEAEYYRLMGIALYNKTQYDEAAQVFDKVLKMDDEDDQAAYYLGASYEALKDYNKAIQYYRLYNELTFYGEYKELVEARIKILYRQQMQMEAQRALQTEQQLDVASIPSNTIAILYFENKGQKAELNPLQKGLAEMIITDLSKVKALKVVERVRLQKLVEEMNLAETDLVDQKTAPRLGKLLGANRLVKGSFFELQADKVNIDAFVTRTRTGELDATTNIAGDMKEFFRLEKDLVFKILDEMKIKISQEEREAILEIPTENFFAFLQYSRGLDLEDRGLYTQAFEAYSKAAQADPDYSQAKTSAASAKNSEQLVGSTDASQTTSEKGTENQQSSSKSSTSRGSGVLSGPGAPPPSDPFNRPGGGSVNDRLGSMFENNNNNLNPGSGNQNQTTPGNNGNLLITKLPEPPTPP